MNPNATFEAAFILSDMPGQSGVYAQVNAYCVQSGKRVRSK